MMKKCTRNVLAGFAALTICASTGATLTANAAYGVGGNGTAVMEYLDRGIYAVKSGNGMFISWRFNADDDDSAEFQLYRDDKLIYTSKAGDATGYQDNDGSQNSKYRIDTVVGGEVVSSENCKFTSGFNYFDIPLKKPSNNHTPNDCSLGDVDGDGQYEIFLKWDPSNSKDNSQEGKTDNVYIDCYRLDGTRLWRVDLGKNIRAGQHYTQFLVADFDLDGKAEMTCKTADGTIDGTGKVIGDASKDYRNGKGYVLDGPEYYTLFDGATGAALDTVDYAFPRGKVSDWGDNYGNRVDRFLGTVAYLDGVRPSAVSVRGYYTRMTVVAYDVVDKKLKVKWKHDSGNDKKKGYGGGNHNVMPADVDNDGKQEIFLGATCIDDDGTVLWANGRGHGDAMHVGDLVPDRPGLEAWVCHEESSQGGVSLLDAATGEAIFHKHTGKDTGRCAGDNVYAGNKGAELWGAESSNVYDSTGKSIGTTRPAQNFLIYWDGDLEREILDGTKISKYTSPSKIDTIFTANGCTSNNSTKSVPCLTADLFGDWREELVMAASDGNSIRIFCTTAATKVRLTTLMHDMQYRMQVSAEQCCYNQPPHVSYYLSSDAALPERPNVVIGDSVTPGGPSIPSTPDVPGTTPSTPNDPDYHPAAEPYTLADLNGDGKVNAVDLVLMKRGLLAKQHLGSAADTNADGTIDIADIVAMQKYLLGSGTMNASFHYAIEAAYGYGVEENTNEGFRGTAYVNLDNQVGSYLEWNVKVPTDGNYLCTFGVANGSTANRIMQISVNGGASTAQDFESTGDWTTWEEVSMTLTLKAGVNTIRMTSDTAEGGPNLDYLKIERSVG